MRIYSLELQNIGTFIEGKIDFITESDDEKHPPVTIITGENGTGKTIILDAIRWLLGGNFFFLERDILRHKSIFKVSSTMKFLDLKHQILGSRQDIYKRLQTNYIHKDNIGFYLGQLLSNHNDTTNIIKSLKLNSIVHYWGSKSLIGTFDIPQNQGVIQPSKDRINNLEGYYHNVELTQLICYFDYLRSSESPKEKHGGELLYETLKRIIKISLNDGELAYVNRTDLQPIINQNGVEITLDKLSSGNLYLIQRLVSLLGKMYALHTLLETPIETVCETEGLLLIDEAETHLHPKWQKTFISNILSIFPNLQIILTTHSPFIVSSVKNAKVYVCKSQGDHCTIEDETEMYANMPVEEILLSPAFGETSPFSKEVEDLMKERKKAIKEGNQTKRTEAEAKLRTINPTYFAYFEVDKLLQEITAR
ncbi:MAG: AAA family ATPase [Thermoflexibacter sp.]|jgi:predicted ATP-binding protein involved in virulence|nr:AAA family ATPase [Thermoflexibacter sp.]